MKCEKNRATFQELTSQIQELHERMNFLNDSREFQDVDSTCSGKLSDVLSQSAVVPSRRSMLRRDHSLRPDTWNLSGTQGNVIGNPRAVIDSSSTLHQECFTLGIKVLQAESQYEIVQGNLSLEVKNEIEGPFQRRDSKRNHQP